MRGPPPHYFLPHFTVSPFKDPKKCPKNSQTQGANSTLFFDPYFRSVFWPFLPKNAKAPFTLISVVLLLSPETTIFLVFFCPCTKKEEDRQRQGGTKFPFFTSQDSELPPPPPPEMLENIGRKIVRPLFWACIFHAKKCRNTSRMTKNWWYTENRAPTTSSPRAKTTRQRQKNVHQRIRRRIRTRRQRRKRRKIRKRGRRGRRRNSRMTRLNTTRTKQEEVPEE